MKALVAAVWLVAVSSPPAGVLTIAVLLPLALPIEYFLGPAPGATAITEAILLAFAARRGPPPGCAATGRNATG